jgi:predicted ATPase
MTMVGRSAELNRLTDLLDEAESGHGCFALVTGEAGIGKSRLVTEWAALGRHRGFVVLTGRAIEGGGSLRPVAHALMEAVRDSEVLESASLRPFRAALSRVLPGIAADEAVASTVDPTVVLGEGVLRLLRSLAGSGTLLVLEDLHWADPDTVALLNYLGGALKTSRVVVAATVREDSPGAAVVGGLVRIPDAIHLRLGTLNYADADLLVEQRHPGLDEAQRMLVIKRAEGVPLVIEELLASPHPFGQARWFG